MERSDSFTRINPPWLRPAQAIWVLLSAVALVMFLIGLVNQHNHLPPSCMTYNAECGPWTYTAEDMQLAETLGWAPGLLPMILTLSVLSQRIVFWLVALVIFIRKPDDWMAWMLSLMMTTWSVEGMWDVGPLRPIAFGVYAVANALFAILPFVFPSGRFVPRWTRWFAVAIAIGLNASLLAFQLTLIVGTAWIVLALYAAIYRYRNVSNPVERQQTKWVMIGLLSSMILMVPYLIVSEFYPPALPTPERLAFTMLVMLPISAGWFFFFAACLAVAIFRHRLWDIDIIVRRTLVYSTLTVLLALVFIGTVVLAQNIFRAVTGQESQIATVASTLAVAGLFTPLRRRVQHTIDRRFFRRKYDAQKVMAAFAERMQHETNVPAIVTDIEHVIAETVQPTVVGVSLIRPSSG